MRLLVLISLSLAILLSPAQSADLDVSLTDLCGVLGHEMNEKLHIKVGQLFLQWIWRWDCGYQQDVPDNGQTVKVAERYMKRACVYANRWASQGIHLGRFQHLYDTHCAQQRFLLSREDKAFLLFNQLMEQLGD